MDLLVALVIILVLALLWRGPKTLPQIGAMFGRGIRSARTEAERMRASSADSSAPPASDEEPRKPT
jgi:Sec-independent protein translocase protein TatA